MPNSQRREAASSDEDFMNFKGIRVGLKRVALPTALVITIAGMAAWRGAVWAADDRNKILARVDQLEGEQSSATVNANQRYQELKAQLETTNQLLRQRFDDSDARQSRIEALVVQLITRNTRPLP